MRKAAPAFTIRAACKSDAAPIAGLLAPYARSGVVLPRSEDEIRQHIHNFLVAEDHDGTPSICGCVALRDYSAGLFEVRSLAVAATKAGFGLGSQLIKASITEAKDRGATRVFALTLRAHLFQRVGFQVVAKEMFPQKVWTDCKHCKKLQCCDETAVLLDLTSTPSVTQ